MWGRSSRIGAPRIESDDMPRPISEIIADLAAKTSGSETLKHMDTMRLYKAIQKLPMEEVAVLVAEMSHGNYAIVPASPPPDWNPVKRRGYQILVADARRRVEGAGPDSPDG